MSYPGESNQQRTIKPLHEVADLHRGTPGLISPHALRIPFLLLCGILCILLMVSRGDGKNAYAATRGVGNDPVKIAVDKAKPAVVRILTTVSGHLLVHFPTGDVLFPRTGGEYTMEFSGSGAFISAHGDILTADHVVRPPGQAFAQGADADITTYANQHNIYGTQVTVDQIDMALQNGQLGTNDQYSSTSSEVYLSTDYTGPQSVPTLRAVPPTLHKIIDRIETESNVNQKDVAIVHVPFTDTPSISLGDSSQVQVQDALTIIGFPGNGDVSNSPTNLLTPSVNMVMVSALKTTDNGASVIQVGGNVEHGDSGGPAIDSQGNVVGVVSFVISDGSVGATSFLQASTSALALVQTLHLDTTSGPFEQEWSQALTDYNATTIGHWHKAAQELTRIATAYPLFQGITPYLTTAQGQARTEPVPQAAPKHSGSTSSSSWLTFPLGVWVAILLVLLLLVVILLSSIFVIRDKRRISMPSRSHPHARQVLASSLPHTSSTEQKPAFASTKESDKLLGFTPARVPQPPLVLPSVTQIVSQSPLPAAPTEERRRWPCEHFNRPKARYCHMCGKPASPLPMLQPVGH